MPCTPCFAGSAGALTVDGAAAGATDFGSDAAQPSNASAVDPTQVRHLEPRNDIARELARNAGHRAMAPSA
jgi:hypothetical protein